MSTTQPANGGASSFQQFERLLQQLHDKQASHAFLIADEAIVVTLPKGTITGAVMPLQRLENILQLLPPERVSARNVAGNVTSLVYTAPSGSWALKVDRSNLAKLRLEISPHKTQVSSPSIAAPIQSAPVRPKKRFGKPLAVAFCVTALFAIGAFGFHWNQVRAEDARLLAVRNQLKTIVLADNALALEILEIDESSHITYAEFFKRAEKNREERDDLIRRIRAIEAGAYSQEAQNFVRLMELETEFVRCTEAVTQQTMQVSTRSDALDEVASTRAEASGELSAANERYMAAPYGEDYSERFEMNVAEAKVNQARAQSKDALALFQKARTEMRVRMDAAVVATNDWINAERRMYPWSFAPPRNIMDALIKKKSKFIVEGSSKASSKAKEQPSQSKVKQVSVDSRDTPSTPTRVRSSEPMDGERFSQTRMREMTSDEIEELTDDDLRYAINEMYARYGMTFEDKDYQSNFDDSKWYKPEDKWTPAQIEKAFNSTEKKNLALLISERSYRQNGE